VVMMQLIHRGNTTGIRNMWRGSEGSPIPRPLDGHVVTSYTCIAGAQLPRYLIEKVPKSMCRTAKENNFKKGKNGCTYPHCFLIFSPVYNEKI
jgi:hypothetical protein